MTPSETLQDIKRRHQDWSGGSQIFRGDIDWLIQYAEQLEKIVARLSKTGGSQE